LFLVVLLVLALIVFGNGIAVARGRATSPTAPSSDCLAAGLAYGAVVWSIVATAALLFLPTSTRTTLRTSADDTTVVTTTHRTLLQNEGRSVLVVFMVPITIAAVGAFAGRRSKRKVRLRAGVLLAIGCFVAAASIGMFFIPSAIALIVAGILTPANESKVATKPQVIPLP
jgi:hypothetical protein